MNDLTPEPGSLTAPEAKALIDAARRVADLSARCIFTDDELGMAVNDLAETLRHVTPEAAHADH